MGFLLVMSRTRDVELRKKLLTP